MEKINEVKNNNVGKMAEEEEEQKQKKMMHQLEWADLGVLFTGTVGCGGFRYLWSGELFTRSFKQKVQATLVSSVQHRMTDGLHV